MRSWRFPLLIALTLCLLGAATSCTPTRRAQTSRETSFIRNPQLRKSVNGWLGAPYRSGGMTKAGVDCSGFVVALYSEVYHISLRKVRTAQKMYKVSRKIGKRSLREGDLVFFRLPRPSDYHVGVYLGQDKFIHATTSKGVIIDNLEMPYYKRSYYRGGRVR